MEHIFTVTKALPPKPYLLSCSCGELYMAICKEDLGVLIKIHWNAVEKKRRIMDEETRYTRVNGDAICEVCSRPYNKHERVKRYDSFTGEELWLVRSCNGSLLKT